MSSMEIRPWIFATISFALVISLIFNAFLATTYTVVETETKVIKTTKCLQVECDDCGLLVKTAELEEKQNCFDRMKEIDKINKIVDEPCQTKNIYEGDKTVWKRKAYDSKCYKEAYDDYTGEHTKVRDIRINKICADYASGTFMVGIKDRNDWVVREPNPGTTIVIRENGKTVCGKIPKYND